MWEFYTQLVHVEEAFKDLKGDLALRPIHHQKEVRIEAHIFVAFMAYTLQEIAIDNILYFIFLIFI